MSDRKANRPAQKREGIVVGDGQSIAVSGLRHGDADSLEAVLEDVASRLDGAHSGADYEALSGEETFQAAMFAVSDAIRSSIRDFRRAKRASGECGIEIEADDGFN